MVAGRRSGKDDRKQKKLTSLPLGEFRAQLFESFESAERGTPIHSLRVPVLTFAARPQNTL